MPDVVLGTDLPEVTTVVDVELSGRRDPLTSFVRRSRPDQVFLVVAKDEEQRPVRLDPGDALTVVWRGPEGLRALPLELVAVHAERDEPLWETRPTGPSVRAQRREAVRTPMATPVRVSCADGEWTGATLDLSEGGTRCAVTVPPAVLPSAGAVVTVSLDLDDLQVTTEAEVVRVLPLGGQRTEFSLRFIGLPERHEDRIRARVFAELRERHRRGLV